jgi:hypothetical protein
VDQSGGGKGLLAVSQLLTWPHSVIVNDIKGDLFETTAGDRAKRGPVVVITIICVNLLKALYRGISVNFHGIVDIVNLQVFYCQATTVYLTHLLPAFHDETGL